MPRPPLPLQLARAAAARVRDALAERTAAPVVSAVRRQGLTRLAPGALDAIHDRVMAAERDDVPGLVAVLGDPKGGVAIVAADGRSSAREVRVAGLTDPGAVAAALTRYGFRPEATRITLHEGLPDMEGDAVAVAFVGLREPGPLRAGVAALAGRLSPGGVLLVDVSAPARRAAVDAALEGLAVERSSASGLMVLRRV